MIIVCSLNDLETVCNSLKPKNLISVIDPGYEPETPSGVKYHLKLGFDDILEVKKDNHIFRNNIDEISQIPPNNGHVKSIINFTESNKSLLLFPNFLISLSIFFLSCFAKTFVFL